jgi:hypothetical protein
MVCVVMWAFAFFTPLCRLRVVYPGPECSRPCPLSSPGSPHAFRVFGGVDLPLFPSVSIFLPLVLCCFSSPILFFSGLAYGSFRM